MIKPFAISKPFLGEGVGVASRYEKIRESVENVGGQRTAKEWSTIINHSTYDIRAALYNKDGYRKFLKTRTHTDRRGLVNQIKEIGGRRTIEEWINLTGENRVTLGNVFNAYTELRPHYKKVRERSVYKFPKEEVKSKFKKAYEENGGPVPAKDLAAKIGMSTEQLYGFICHNPEYKKYRLPVHNYYSDFISYLEKEWDGVAKTNSEWKNIMEVCSSTIQTWKRKLDSNLANKVFFDYTKWRIQQVKSHPKEKTLSEWALFFDMNLSAIHHFFTRKNLHHYRKDYVGSNK